MRTKRCSRCHVIKEHSEFHLNSARKDGRYNYCIPCRKEYDAEYQKNNRDKINEQQRLYRTKQREWWFEVTEGLVCVTCGEPDFIVLEFHHRDPGTKKFGLANYNKFSKRKVLEEMEKCDVLCANCHRRLHWDMKYGN